MTTLTKKKNKSKKKETTYKLPLVLAPQPEGGYTVTCPLLPELITEGDTIQEAMTNVSDALSALLEVYQTLKRPVPAVLKQNVLETPVWLDAIVVVN